MRRNLLLTTALVGLAALPSYASVVTFFGEDVEKSGDPNTATPTNSNAAKASFFSNLTGVGTQTFESYAPGTSLPLTIGFMGAGSATLTDPTNTSLIVSGNDGAGRFPISGSNYLETGAGSGFTLTFSSPIAAFGFYGTDVGDFGGALSLGLTDAMGNTSSLNIGNTLGSNGSTSGSVLYFGFYDTTDTYKSITFNNVGSGGVDVFGFDDFSIGSSAQVTPSTSPEPGTYLLMATGLLAVLIFRKKVFKSSSLSR